MTSLRMGLSSEKMTGEREQREAERIRAAKPGPCAPATPEHEAAAHHADPDGRHEPHRDLKLVLFIKRAWRQIRKQSARGNAQPKAADHARKRLPKPIAGQRLVRFHRPYCLRCHREAPSNRARSNSTPINGQAVRHAIAAVNTMAS